MLDIELDGSWRYGLGLLGFYSYNSTHNIDESNNFFIYRKKNKTTFQSIKISMGVYEIDKINRAIINGININNKQLDNSETLFSLRANKNTLLCERFVILHLVLI